MTQQYLTARDWSDTVPTAMRAPMLLGLAILAVSLIGFGLWAVTAPLQSAVVASGKFVATGKNKTVQHLEGGIIRQIRVGEGDQVSQGAVLISLDDTGPRANLQLLTHRFNRMKAVQARLIAESKLATSVAFPADLIARAEAETDSQLNLILARQREEFQARRQKFDTQTAIFEREIATRQQAIEGYEAEIASIEVQLQLIAQELESKKTLYRKKLVSLPKLLELKRAEAQLAGRVARLRSSIAEEGKNIAKTQGQIVHLRASMVDLAVAELRKVEGGLDDVSEQLRKARDVLHRVDIVAPVDGVVVKLLQHTPGGVIKPGSEILEIVPVGHAPIIEARVKPRDIDQIAKGQAVQVRLTALNQRLIPTVPGEVVYVSADTVAMGRRGEAGDGYVVRVTLQADKVAALKNFEPTPGMPVEAFIKTGERTFFDYLMQPLVDSMARAFRES
jgi:HlyD family secretion protein